MAAAKNNAFGFELSRMVGVGKITDESVRIWLRTDRAGDHELEVWPDRQPAKGEIGVFKVPDGAADLTDSVAFPGDFPGLSPLQPLQRYRFRITRSNGRVTVGIGSFQTAPKGTEDTPEKFSIGVMSCHQPFEETSGLLSDASMRMLRLARAALLQHDARLVLLCGDQIYSDHPERCNLFEQHYTSSKLPFGSDPILMWPAATVRKAFQQRYRQFWWMKEIQYVHGHFPCYPILDDHEIVDDWGSKVVHARPTKYTDWSRLKVGALQAYADYQATRVMPPMTTLPDSLHYRFEYGTVGGFVLDLRSQRSIADGRLIGKSQFADFERFLKESADKHAILVVASVPVVHLPDWLTNVGASIAGDRVDFPDHWSYKKNIPTRNRFLNLLRNYSRNHPRQKIILVSGDVHIGCAFAIRWKAQGDPTIYQFTSSAISNKMKKAEVEASVHGPSLFGLTDSIQFGGQDPAAQVSLLKGGKGGLRNNPFGGLNLGIIEVRKRGNESGIVLKLMGYTEEDHQTPVAMFESEEL